ncbi:hypothetical protein BCR42DRAFT_396737 [Absidia repens]|uniref:SH3 domain-containing protein n=1 Tax=Absidia repens TaxID=90262 RepID=A0A1X2I4M2_9FUNG|nr:hypothetical protein BCR42DRAFT_396737 [Absidia repens]
MLPKKIIKATMPYSAQHQHELSFEKGDFFHVVGRENDRRWYAVNNPLTNVDGLVPVSHFQVVDKSTRTMNVIQPTLPLDYQHHPYQHHSEHDSDTLTKRSSTGQQSNQRCYGIVLYDFVAERPDELGCKADETIIVIAQSNKEWYVAKPIGRLGGPGLIPVSFVQLYDIVTNHPVLLPTTGYQSISSPRTSFSIPKLGEWKKQTQIYEESSIPLSGSGIGYSVGVDPLQHSKNTLRTNPDHGSGDLSLSSNSSGLSNQHHWYSPSKRKEQRHRSTPSSSSSPSLSPSPALLHLQQQQRHSYESSITSSRRSSEIISKKNQNSSLRHTQLQSSIAPPSARRTSIYNASTSQDTKVVDITANSFILEDDQYWFVFYATVSNGRHRILYRTYEYFYQFHVRLLQEYPIEAGKGENERILPLMPAPLDKVDDHITEQRREDLDYYCKKLLKLPSYISESDIIQMELFGLKKCDVETDYAMKKGSRVIKSNNISNHGLYAEQPVAQHPHQHQQTQNRTSQPKNIQSNKIHGIGTTQYDGGVGTVKLKIIYKDDIFAVKISTDCTMQELRSRIKDRLGGGDLGTMKYKDDTHHHKPLETEMDMEEAFILAIQHGKLTIAVDS